MVQALRSRPIYFVVDRSAQMGPHLGHIQEGLASVTNGLRGDLSQLELGRMSVISYAETTSEDVPLTELMHFRVPKLSATEETQPALRIALDDLNASIEAQSDDSLPGKPLVFLLAGATPSKPEVAALMRAQAPVVDPAMADIVSIGCNPQIDHAVLKQVATDKDRAFVLQDNSANGWASLFKALTTPVTDAIRGEHKVRWRPMLELKAFATAKAAPKDAIPQRKRSSGTIKSQKKIKGIPSRVVRDKPAVRKERKTLNLGGWQSETAEKPTTDVTVKAEKKVRAKAEVGTAFVSAEKQAAPDAKNIETNQPSSTITIEKKNRTTTQQKKKSPSIVEKTKAIKKEKSRKIATPKQMNAWTMTDGEKVQREVSTKKNTAKSGKNMQAIESAWGSEAGTNNKEQPKMKQAQKKKVKEAKAKAPEPRKVQPAATRNADKKLKTEKKTIAETPAADTVRPKKETVQEPKRVAQPQRRQVPREAVLEEGLELE